MQHGRKYIRHGRLCAFGCYLQREHVLDDLKALPVPQKNLLCPLGKAP